MRLFTWKQHFCKHWQHALGVISIIAVLVALDQGTKTWILQQACAGNVPLDITNWLRLTCVFNTGISFGLGSNLSAWLLITLSTFITGWFFYMYCHTKGLGERLGLLLILGGACGNMWDRLRLGQVVDFIDVHSMGYHFPTFNVADMCITAGAAIVGVLGVFASFFTSRKGHADAS